MNQAGEAKTEPNSAPAAGPSHLRWDTSELKSHRCTVATASATRDEIILNFGARPERDDRGGDVAVELLQRIALSPLTAKHLIATLEKLIAEHDSRSRRST
jgi:hypothetical protein